MTERRTAIVTGASSGIGRAVAARFGRRGWSVAVGARRAERLDDVVAAIGEAGGAAFAQPLDVGDPESVERFADAVSDALGPADVLVNNAGIAWPGDVARVEPERLAEMVRTNLLGPLLLTRRFLGPLLDAQRTGDVVMIGSDAAQHPRPALLTYGATKAALEELARGLALELEGTGIRVSTVRAGPTLTDFAGDWGEPERFAGLVERWQRFGLQRHFSTLDPDDVAAAVEAVVRAPSTAWCPVVEVQPHPPATAR